MIKLLSACSAGQILSEGGMGADVIAIQVVQPFGDVVFANHGGDRQLKVFLKVVFGPGVQLAQGVGEEAHLGAYVIFDQIDAGLQVGEDAGLIFLLRLIRGPGEAAVLRSCTNRLKPLE